MQAWWPPPFHPTNRPSNRPAPAGYPPDTTTVANTHPAAHPGRTTRPRAGPYRARVTGTPTSHTTGDIMNYQHFHEGAKAARRYLEGLRILREARQAVRPHPCITWPLPDTVSRRVTPHSDEPGRATVQRGDSSPTVAARSCPATGRGRHRGPRRPLWRWTPWRAA